MSPARDAARELDQLLMALMEGELSLIQQQHLAALLRDDPVLQERYRNHLLLDSLLCWNPPVSPPTAAPLPPQSRSVRWLAVLAASLLLVVMGYQLHAWRQRSTGQPELASGQSPGDSERHANGLAVLTRSVQARWAADCPPLAVGGTVAPGPLHLRSGLVQLEFYSGATLVIEGPADIEVLATDRLRCRSGKLRAMVPPQARGFTVLSPTADLVDLGTEFGLEVAPGGATELHVFAGKVQVHGAGASHHGLVGQEVAAGRGLQVDTRGQLREVPVNDQRFASADDIERQVRRAVAERHAQWQKASEQTRRDPRVVLSYPFLCQTVGERILRTGGPADPSLDGAIIGCEWGQGRWPGKQALEFKRPGDRVRLTVPGQFDALTLSTWVRVDALEHRFNALFLTDGFEVGAAHWQITQEGKLRLCICHGASEGKWLGNTYDSYEVFRPEAMGQWKHLVTVFDGPAGKVRHHVNGQPVGEHPLRARPRLAIGRVELGNWGAAYAGDRTPLRNFTGRMDEFTLYRVALSEQEIEALYRAGEPIR